MIFDFYDQRAKYQGNSYEQQCGYGNQDSEAYYSHLQFILDAFFQRFDLTICCICILLGGIGGIRTVRSICCIRHSIAIVCISVIVTLVRRSIDI